MGTLQRSHNQGGESVTRERPAAKKLATPNWIASYVHHIASVTGWAFRDIMEMPLSAGLQIIDADLYSKGIDRIYTRAAPSFDSKALIDEAFNKLLK